jgi:hypothetical protein
MACVSATYDNYEELVSALRAVKESGIRDYEAYGPISLAEVEDLMPRRESAVRTWATGGALVGVVSFWYMCVRSSLIYSIITGGKPPVSNVPFVILMYEGTILVGALAAFIATIVLAHLWFREPPPDYDPQFSGSDFGIQVRCHPGEKEHALEVLRSTSAVEVHEID